VDQLSAAQAVEELIRKYDRLVFHTIYGMTGDWEESQDLTQDTFQQALKGIEAARSASGEQFHEKAWLLRIAVNTVRMQQRRRNLLRFVPFSRLSPRADSEETLSERPAPVQPAGYGIETGADPAELAAERDAVRRTLARLPVPLRECLILSISGDFSTREIATMLGLQEAAVRQRLTRARKQFQQLYARESGDSSAPLLNTDAPGRQGDRRSIHEQRLESHSEENTLPVQRLKLAHVPH
jgi:RNA polymerase sigma factor (sigma-70 family)